MIKRCNQTWYLWLITVVVLILIFLFFNHQTVYADDLKGLTLSPLRSELDISPGTSLGGVLTVKNSTDKPMTVNLTAEEFSVINQQYDYAFMAESDTAKWVTFSPVEINLATGESKEVQYTVGAPLTAEPGGYYISMFASTAVGLPGDAGNSQQRVASLLYITVASDVLGAVTRAGHVLSLSSPWLMVDKGIWGMTIQNGGTTHFRSAYSVKIENIFGGKVSEDQNSALILPNTIRAISGESPAPSVPGIYKVIYTVGLGDTPNVVETHYMLYLPIWAITIITAAIVAGGYWLYRKVYRKH
jgi:hypothetical protein